MKIESNPKITDITNSQPKKVEKSNHKQSFSKTLAETINPHSSQNAKVISPPSVPGLKSLQNSVIRDELERTHIATKLEQLLDVLDQYRMHLENPWVSLKEMAPLTYDMAAKLKELEPALERLDQQDPLTSILNETLITATLEMKKFENGWYNPLD
jgi:hypothetical protein